MATVYPPKLTKIVAKTVVGTTKLTKGLEAGGDMTPIDWESKMKQLLAEHHLDAMKAGLGDEPLTTEAKAAIANTLKQQFGFLKDFRVEIANSEAFMPGWLKRAALYAEAVKGSYWRGSTRLLPLPAMPGDGTSQCLGNCHCQWQVDWLEGDGNANARWVLGGGDHCQTCLERAGHWSPIKVRGGDIGADDAENIIVKD